MVLIFFGTLDQVEYGIHHTQKRYFESYFVIWQYPEQWAYSEILRYLAIPMPGGHLIGYLLLINLLAAHSIRFKLTKSKLGINITHGGLILLLIAEFMTDYVAVESQMWLDEGGSSNYSFSIMENEVVIIDHSEEDHDTVHSVPSDWMVPGKSFDVQETPFTIETHRYYRNSRIARATNPNHVEDIPITQGWGAKMKLIVEEQKYDYSESGKNVATAVVTIKHKGEEIGTWLLSNLLNDQFPTQKFEVDGKSYSVALRLKRFYLPYRFHLIDFSHDKYPGTEIPRNFSSKIRIMNPAHNDEDREALIYMNNPLRYEGLTFYQQSFANNDKTSVLQVVRNPGWTLPYISVVLVGIGLTIQFVMHLSKFLRRKRA